MPDKKNKAPFDPTGDWADRKDDEYSNQFKLAISRNAKMIAIMIAICVWFAIITVLSLTYEISTPLLLILCVIPLLIILIGYGIYRSGAWGGKK